MSDRIETAIRRHRQEKRLAWVATLAIGAFAMGGLAMAQSTEMKARQMSSVPQPAPQAEPQKEAPRAAEPERQTAPETRRVRIIAIAGMAPSPLVATR